MADHELGVTKLGAVPALPCVLCAEILERVDGLDSSVVEVQGDVRAAEHVIAFFAGVGLGRALAENLPEGDDAATWIVEGARTCAFHGPALAESLRRLGLGELLAPDEGS